MPLAATELNRLAREGDLLVTRNTERGIVVFTDEASKISVTWEGANDAAGGDVVECPATFLKNPKFREIILRGLIEVEEAPEVLQEALDRQKAEWDQRQQKAKNAEVELQRTNDRVVARGVSCIAPAGKGALCGSYGLVMGQNPSERPPLCAEHQHMASQYVSSETGRTDANGKSETTWQRVATVRVSS